MIFDVHTTILHASSAALPAIASERNGAVAAMQKIAGKRVQQVDGRVKQSAGDCFRTRDFPVKLIASYSSPFACILGFHEMDCSKMR